MKLYAVRKRRGQWAVSSEENTVLEFKTYDEAIETARGAVEVLAHRDTEPEASQETRPAGKPAGLETLHLQKTATHGFKGRCKPP